MRTSKGVVSGQVSLERRLTNWIIFGVRSRMPGWPERYRYHAPPEILSRIPLQARERILEVGCGKGYFTRALLSANRPGWQVVAIDVSCGLLKELRHTLAGEQLLGLVCTEAFRYPFPAGTFSAIICAFVLHEARDRMAVLKEVARVLTTRGRLLVVEWQWPAGDRSRLDRIARADMMDLLAKSGFADYQLVLEDVKLYAILARKT